MTDEKKQKQIEKNQEIIAEHNQEFPINLDYLNRDIETAYTTKSLWKVPYDRVSNWVGNFNDEVQPRTAMGQHQNKKVPKYTNFMTLCVKKSAIQLQNNITPMKSPWMKLTDQEGNKIDEHDWINGMLGKSNFDIVAEKFYKNIIVLGTGFLYFYFNPLTGRLTFNNVPYRDIAFKQDENGDVNSYYKLTNLSGLEMKEYYLKIKGFEKLVPTIDPKKYYQLYEVWCEYEGRKYFAIFKSALEQPTDQKNIVLTNDIIMKIQGKDLIYWQEIDFFPFITIRINQQNNELYGTGIGMETLDSAELLNKLYKAVGNIVNYSQPTFLVENKGLLNEKNGIRTGGIIAVKSNETSRPSITPLQIDTSSLNTTYQYILDLKQEISDMFNVPNLQNPLQTGQKTATEINQLVSNASGNLFSMLFAIQAQFERHLSDIYLCCQLYNKKQLVRKVKDIEFSIINNMVVFFEKKISSKFEMLQIVANIDPNLLNVDKYQLNYDLLKDVFDESEIRNKTGAEKYLQQLQQQAQQQGGQ
ncbi:MAG: head-tail connector protein [Rickettsiales bacterium]|jgi:hypothetical protein|nr:head-tail connector protein [Rickettsiales bacterium]